ncbi:hypothetical protein Y032_0116g580 [Ancylostoma ceylanicum]|nr:hypothetical protein Y032_0116g580 [Ancylostoma ceylanicum]
MCADLPRTTIGMLVEGYYDIPAIARRPVLCTYAGTIPNKAVAGPLVVRSLKSSTTYSSALVNICKTDMARSTATLSLRPFFTKSSCATDPTPTCYSELSYHGGPTIIPRWTRN